MQRRDFLTAAGLMAATAGARRAGWAWSESGVGTPLRQPPEMRPQDLLLSVRPGRVAIDSDRTTDAWMYLDALPGPTLRVTRGEEARITLLNELPEETITHWHGLMVAESADGHPRLAIPPGGRYEYRFTVDQGPGLSWYHPHTHMRTATQVHRGLAGLVVVEDPDLDESFLPAKEQQLLLVLQDRTITSQGDMPMASRGPTMMAGFFGDTVLVNGVADAVALVTPARWRLRILNGSAARIYDLVMSDGRSFMVVGGDGGLLPAPVSVDHCLLAPAERVDLLIDFSALRGRSVRMASRAFTLPQGRQGPMMMGRGAGMMMGRQGEAIDVMQFAVSDTAPVSARYPVSTPARPLPSLPRGAREQRFAFSTMGMNHTINGRTFDLARPDVFAKAGSGERWTFVNDGPFPHPVHLHAAQFLVRERRGGRGAVFPAETGLKDTVLVAPTEEVTVDVHFGPHRGLFLLHCHNLQHEDMGMMLNVALE